MNPHYHLIVRVCCINSFDMKAFIIRIIAWITQLIRKQVHSKDYIGIMVFNRYSKKPLMFGDLTMDEYALLPGDVKARVCIHLETQLEALGLENPYIRFLDHGMCIAEEQKFASRLPKGTTFNAKKIRLLHTLSKKSIKGHAVYSNCIEPLTQMNEKYNTLEFLGFAEIALESIRDNFTKESIDFLEFCMVPIDILMDNTLSRYTSGLCQMVSAFHTDNPAGGALLNCISARCKNEYGERVSWYKGLPAISRFPCDSSEEWYEGIQEYCTTRLELIKDLQERFANTNNIQTQD